MFFKGSTMIHNRLQALLFVATSLTIASLISMDGKNVPTIDFKNKSLQQLNEFAIVNEVLALTPRSRQSLQDKLQELGITMNSGEFIYTALSGDGKTPARPGDVIKFIATKQYYAHHKQMPPDNHRPILMIQASSLKQMESMLSDILGPNGLACAYPDAPTASYGPGVQPHNAGQISQEDFGLSALFKEYNLK